ncbi:MAG: tRNA dihydrouridine synthase DusB [Ignavibacteriae bacterium HGW-Ignavibacteriae-4]|jgi:tRNA-dihydrouridine synthase B|nr:MAG: tRNA dihydrouridine synthase DusB [Ignavibacteriae bacterium HGW-Ignavibacteriae-4]
MKIGNVEIGNGIFLAPMEDVSDLPFRVICKKLGADIVYSEFIASEGIIRHSRQSQRKLIIDPEERPTAIQIFGADVESMVTSAKIVEDSGADILDINYGCWVKKVVQREAGAAFLKQPERMVEQTRAVVEAVNIPVTVKTRLGWDQENIIAVDVAQMMEQAGAKAFAIHCRTRSMGMTGKADWSWVPKIKENVTIPVILNGDVRSAEDCKIAFEEYNADALMIGRACIGYPFIFHRAKVMMEQGFDPGEPDLRLKIDTCLEHLRLTVEHRGEHGLLVFRKHYSGYLKGYYNASAVRRQLMEFTTFDAVRTVLEKYYDELDRTDKLEPISKVRTVQKLSCESDAYVDKQTAGT